MFDFSIENEISQCNEISCFIGCHQDVFVNDNYEGTNNYVGSKVQLMIVDVDAHGRQLAPWLPQLSSAGAHILLLDNTVPH